MDLLQTPTPLMPKFTPPPITPQYIMKPPPIKLKTTPKKPKKKKKSKKRKTAYERRTDPLKMTLPNLPVFPKIKF